MARTENTTQLKCIICGNPIPSDRRSDSVTCSNDCSKKRIDYIRSRIDATECRYCGKPSSVEERERYRRWRNWEKQGAKIEDSVPNLLKKIQTLQRKLEERGK